MHIGLLWHNNDPKTTMTEKVGQAADYYANKYGKAPNLCFVHPSMLADGETMAGQVRVRARQVYNAELLLDRR